LCEDREAIKLTQVTFRLADGPLLVFVDPFPKNQWSVSLFIVAILRSPARTTKSDDFGAFPRTSSRPIVFLLRARKASNE